MFDKLEDLVRRNEEITNELTEPSVVNDQNRFRKLMKEQSDLQPLVTAYTEYKKCQETEERKNLCLLMLIFPFRFLSLSQVFRQGRYWSVHQLR